MKYLLDTCTISFLLKGNASVIGHIKHAKPSELAISSITMLELEYGFKLAKSKHLDNLYSKWQRFLRPITVLDFSKETALVAANISASLKKAGLMIGAYDILIGAIALNHNLTCVTNNVSEFKRIDNLKVLDWSI
jgi:tRNA(fMet)-specific endonuclease VapC